MRVDDEGGGARRVPDAGRRHALVRIAYRHIVERGFEGLRVREVAREAGMTHATLLYYFPTKEALIQAVVGYLAHEFSVSRLPDLAGADQGALGDVRREFADVRHRIRTTPEMFVVLSELAVRSRRDPAIAHILQALEAGWRGHLVDIMGRGVADGVFRSDLDVDAAALALMAQLAAIGYRVLGPSAAEIDHLIAQLAAQTEHWLTTSSAPSPTEKETGR